MSRPSLFLCAVVCLCVSWSLVVSGYDLARDLVNTYQKVMTERGFPSFNAATLVEMYKLHDADGNCGVICEQHVKSLFDGVDSSDWEFFYKLITKVYAGQISMDPYMPQEIHLQLTDTPKEMKVMWATMSNLENPYVEYVRTGHALKEERADKLERSHTITSDDIDWSKSSTSPATNYTYTVPQKWWPVFDGVLYETNMENLIPEVMYSYRVCGFDIANNTNRFSDTFTFRAAPQLATEAHINNANRRTRSVFLADHGTFEFLGFAIIRKMVALRDPNPGAAVTTDADPVSRLLAKIDSSYTHTYNQPFVFEHTMLGGDLSYAGLSSAMPLLNIDKEDEFERIWDLLGIQNQPIAATAPWMIAVGNHERFYDWSAVTNRYRMPASKNAAANSNGNFWYSYDYGNVHWIGISSEHDLDVGSDQYNWLVGDLQQANANRANVPWVFMVLHKPLYCSDDGTPHGYADKLEALCVQYDVDMTLTGHMHAYERVHPVIQGEVQFFPTKGRFDYATGDYLGADESAADAKYVHNEPVFTEVTGAETPIVRVDRYIYPAGVKGPMHIVQGNSGAMQVEKWVQPAPAWSAIRMANGYRVPSVNRTASEAEMFASGLYAYSPLNISYTDTFGFGHIDAINATHLHYTSYPITGHIGRDEFWVIKNHMSV